MQYVLLYDNETTSYQQYTRGDTAPASLPVNPGFSSQHHFYVRSKPVIAFIVEREKNVKCENVPLGKIDHAQILKKQTTGNICMTKFVIIIHLRYLPYT